MISYATFFLLHFWHVMYVPAHGPWYNGVVWGNVFVVPVAAALGYLWSKTKFWPLKPIHRSLERLHEKHDKQVNHLENLQASLDQLHVKHDLLHAKHDELHERVIRLHDRGYSATEGADAHLSKPLSPDVE